MAKYNEIKYRILKTLFYARKYLTPAELARQVGTSLHAVTDRLTELFKLGYIWRRQEYRMHTRNEFCYKYLKPKGISVYFKLNERVVMREITGIFIELNLKKPIPAEAIQQYQAVR